MELENLRLSIGGGKSFKTLSNTMLTFFGIPLESASRFALTTAILSEGIRDFDCYATLSGFVFA
jgi:hypothetical protein